MNIGVQARSGLSVLIEPVWWLASLPSRMWTGVDDELATRQALQDSNEQLLRQLQILNARMQRMQAVNEENQRLRGLLNANRNGSLQVQMIKILNVDLNPYQQRIVLDAGTRQGVLVGQAIMDAGGILGQVIEASDNKATALLVTDVDHATPVQVVRSGFRGIAFGTGEPDSLQLRDIPRSADIRVGDLLVTSGMGGRFPAGFPVAKIESLKPNETGLFMLARAKPSARLDRGLEVLLVNEIIPAPPLAPPPSPVVLATPTIAPENASAANAKANTATQTKPTETKADSTNNAAADEKKNETP